MNGAHLLDSGVGFVVGDAGTILKTTDAGMTWSPVTSGTTNALHDVYFFDATQGVVVGDQGLILRTTDGGTGWQGVASGVMDGLRAVSFSGVNGISAGDSQTFSIQPIQDLRGRSVKADFSDPRCSDPETSSNSSSATYSALKDRS